MMDPYISMELFDLGISMEKPTSEITSDLSRERTIELVKESNEYAFSFFKKNYISQMKSDPMMMPVLISAISHDWIKKNHGYDEENFKSALFNHKIYEDPEVSMHMQQK